MSKNVTFFTFSFWLKKSGQKTDILKVTKKCQKVHCTSRSIRMGPDPPDPPKGVFRRPPFGGVPRALLGDLGSKWPLLGVQRDPFLDPFLSTPFKIAPAKVPDWWPPCSKKGVQKVTTSGDPGSPDLGTPKIMVLTEFHADFPHILGQKWPFFGSFWTPFLSPFWAGIWPLFGVLGKSDSEPALRYWVLVRKGLGPVRRWSKRVLKSDQIWWSLGSPDLGDPGSVGPPKPWF